MREKCKYRYSLWVTRASKQMDKIIKGLKSLNKTVFYWQTI